MFGSITKLRNAIREMRAYDPEMAYLNEATSRVDLERRQRDIDTGRFRRRPQF